MAHSSVSIILILPVFLWNSFPVLIQGDPQLQFNRYTRYEEIGASDIPMTCVAQDAVGWSTFRLNKEIDSGGETVIFQWSKGGSPNEPLSPRVRYNYSSTDDTVWLSVTFSTLLCDDTGRYICRATGTNFSLNTEVILQTYRNPGTPLLTLRPDQIADLGYYRGGFEHTCQSEVGFPPGTIHLVYRKPGEAEFAPFSSNQITQFPTDTVNTDCGTTKSFKFGLNFTKEDNGGEVKCVVENTELNVTTESAIGILELIPRHYCNITGSPAFRYHPTNCNKWIECYSGYPYGNQCPSPDECITMGTYVTCGSCDGVICPVNFTTTPMSLTPSSEPPNVQNEFGDGTICFSLLYYNKGKVCDVSYERRYQSRDLDNSSCTIKTVN